MMVKNGDDPSCINEELEPFEISPKLRADFRTFIPRDITLLASNS